MVARPEQVDSHGVRHRFGCPMPGWTSAPSRALRGVHVLRCPACGAIKIHSPHAAEDTPPATAPRRTA